MNVFIYEVCRETIGGVRKVSRHVRPRRSSPSCRDEKEREKDKVADDDGCACVYVGLRPSVQRERRETAAKREKQKPTASPEFAELQR
ncbi:hypothetical protein ACFX16_008256 [Malus domestica]